MHLTEAFAQWKPVRKKGDTVVTLTIYGEESLLWKLIPVKAETTASLHKEKENLPELCYKNGY